jgi:hypothetical protein
MSDHGLQNRPTPGLRGGVPQLDDFFGPGRASAAPPAPEAAAGARPRRWLAQAAGLSAVGLLGLVAGMLIGTSFDAADLRPQLHLGATPSPGPRAADALLVAAPAPRLRTPTDAPAGPVASPDVMAAALSDGLEPAVDASRAHAAFRSLKSHHRARPAPLRSPQWPYAAAVSDAQEGLLAAAPRDDLRGLY